MLFCGAPIDRGRRRMFFTVGVPSTGDAPADRLALDNLRGFVERLLAEDEPVLESMRFRRGTLVASDRHLASYFRYVSDFPRAAPPGV